MPPTRRGLASLIGALPLFSAMWLVAAGADVGFAATGCGELNGLAAPAVERKLPFKATSQPASGNVDKSALDTACVMRMGL